MMWVLDITHHALSEHHEMDELVEKLEETDMSNPSWLATAKQLSEKVHHHLKEEEHKFWDNVDYNNYHKFTFHVEEYKRPTFEINFNDIKERYTIGDTLKISGNVKTLAGSNVTDAKVVWNVNRSVYLTEYYPNQENQNITIENVTDENGNFSISLIAADSILKNFLIFQIRNMANSIDNTSYYPMN